MELSEILLRSRQCLETEGSETARHILGLDSWSTEQRSTPFYALQACEMVAELEVTQQGVVADGLLVALALSDWSCTTQFVELCLQNRQRLTAMIGMTPSRISVGEVPVVPLLPPRREEPVARYAVHLLRQAGWPVA